MQIKAIITAAAAGLFGLLAGMTFPHPQVLIATAKITCPVHQVKIANRSSNVIQLLDIRWLNTDGIEWIVGFFEPQSIEPGENWRKRIALTGLSTPATFLKARYHILGGTGLEDEFTSEQAVPSCHSDRHSTLKIVDKRR